jgi:hypothetical protein
VTLCAADADDLDARIPGLMRALTGLEGLQDYGGG